mgnify:CR=1 FL=1
MMGCYCSFRNRLYKLLGRYAICLICQVGLPKCGPNLCQIAQRLANANIEPIENPTLEELLLKAIKVNKNCKNCCPPPGNICVGIGLGSNIEFISYYLGEYVYRLLYGLRCKNLDQKLCRIFSYPCPAKRRRCLNELLLQALQNEEE